MFKRGCVEAVIGGVEEMRACNYVFVTFLHFQFMDVDKRSLSLTLGWLTVEASYNMGVVQ